MNTLAPLGKFLLIAGIILAIIGIIIAYGPMIPFIGRLPGDIYIKRENFSFYFPITSSIIISIILTLIFFLISRFKQAKNAVQYTSSTSQHRLNIAAHIQHRSTHSTSQHTFNIAAQAQHQQIRSALICWPGWHNNKGNDGGRAGHDKSRCPVKPCIHNPGDNAVRGQTAKKYGHRRVFATGHQECMSLP